VGGSTEGGDDDDVVLGEGIVLMGHLTPWQRDDVHVCELSVDFRVVDNFPDEVDIFVVKDGA